MGGKAGWLGALIVLGASVGIPAAGAAWLQEGYDAAHTGHSPDQGPATDDVAWSVILPGARVGTNPPVILDGHVYTLTVDATNIAPHLTTNGLWRVPLATGTPELLLSWDERPRTFASDGERFYVAFDRAVEAYALTGGAPLWSVERPSSALNHTASNCISPSVTSGTLYLVCNEVDHLWVGARPTDASQRVNTYAMATNAATGELRWLWMLDASDQGRQRLPSQVPPIPEAPPVVETTWSFPRGLSVIGPYVFVTTFDTRNHFVGNDTIRATAGATWGSLWALRETDGALLWSTNTTELSRGVSVRPNQVAVPGVNSALSFTRFPTGDPNVIYLKADRQIHALNPATGAEIWSDVIGVEDVIGDTQGSGFALSQDAVFVASRQSIYRFNSTTYGSEWRYTLDPSRNESLDALGLVLSGDTLYAESYVLTAPFADGALYALDAVTGRPRWRFPFDYAANTTAPVAAGVGGIEYSFSLGEGVVALGSADGALTVLGRTDASPVVQPWVSSMAPAPGEKAVVDLANTTAGAFGPATSWRVDWGDGHTSEWQPTPTFAHDFAEAGDYRTRLQARNDANQTSSDFVVFRVGAPKPVELSPLQQALAPENQNLTLFALGLAATVAATVPGVARLRRRRERLQEELRAIDQAYAMTKERPAECEAALAERKTHARALLLDHKLDEAQFGIVENRVDELARTVRLSSLDRRFHFLPYGMVQTLQGMLEDGRISAWEHQHFVDALERDPLLTAEQKAKVRALIDEWFARDAGAAGGKP